MHSFDQLPLSCQFLDFLVIISECGVAFILFFLLVLEISELGCKAHHNAIRLEAYLGPPTCAGCVPELGAASTMASRQRVPCLAEET